MNLKEELLGKIEGYLNSNDPESNEVKEFETALGNLSAEDKEDFYKSIPPEQQTQMAKKSAELLSEITARRKEKQRLEAQPPAQSDYGESFRKENVEKAAQQFFSEYGIVAEQQQFYRDLFAKNDQKHVNVDLIFQNFESVYASQNAPELLKIRKEHEQMRQNAEDFNSQGASAHGGSGGTPPEGKVYSKEVHDWVRESKRRGVDISFDEAERTLNQGMIRRIG